MRCLRLILGITWKDKVTNNELEVLIKAVIPSMYTLLRQRTLRWLGHIYSMDHGRIPKDLLYELAKGKRLVGRPKLGNKNVCKRNMKSTALNV